MKYYAKGAYEQATNPPKNSTIWDIYKKIIDEYDPDVPIIKYFNHTYTSSEYKTLIESWARAFKAMGVEPGEMVPVYGTWSPDISAMFFALNAIGAYPYFEKLDITKEALDAETKGAKIAVVHSALWGKVVRDVFAEDRFQKVIVSNTYDDVKGILKGIIKVKTSIDAKKSGLTIPNDSKYVMAKEALAECKKYSGLFEETFQPDRIAAVTSSSGTTSAVVKGIMDTNESMIANLISSYNSDLNEHSGEISLLSLPPTASTALNCLFLLPMMHGMTLLMDPRVDIDNFYKQVIKNKIAILVTTGPMMEALFRKIEADIKKGKKYDFSHVKGWTIGGSGTTNAKYDHMNAILRECGSETNLILGYGSSEVFGVASLDRWNEGNPLKDKKDVTDVGIPSAGFIIGAFDETGNELPYNTRGELRIKGGGIMDGYFNKPELTKQVMEDGWYKTGDIGEVDENGFIYVYGRKKDTVEVEGVSIYLFDIANDLRINFYLDDCIAEKKQLADGKFSIVVYFVQKPDQNIAEEKLIPEMNSFIREKYPISVDGYKEFKIAFPISPTTLKPQTRQMEGFMNIDDAGRTYNVTYTETQQEDILAISKM